MILSERITRVKESPTLATAAKARALAAKGRRVINFGPGEPDFDTPTHITQACIEALKAGATRYGPVAGIPELRQAIAEKLRRENRLAYSPDQIIVTCGVKEAIYGALQVLIQAGDEVIIPVPNWVSYGDQVLLCDGTPVVVVTPEANGFKLTPEALEAAITPKTKLLILGNPCNPTGSVYTRDELAALAAVCARRNLWVLADEIYEHLTYPPAEFVSFAAAAPTMGERAILVNGPSKAYAMTGWRIGFAAGPAEVVRAMVTWQGQVVTHPTTFAQKGTVEAYAGPQEAVTRMRTAFQERRDSVLNALRQIPDLPCVRPDGAFYLFPNVTAYLSRQAGTRRVTTAADLADYLLDQAHLAVVPGEAFGTPGYLRLSYALGMPDIEEGLRRLKEALTKLL